MIVGKLLTERIKNWGIRTRQFPSLIIAAMRIREDKARFIVGIFMPIDGKENIQRNADKETQGEGEGDDICESFPGARPTKRNSKQRKGKKKEERERRKADQPVPRLQGR